MKALIISLNFHPGHVSHMVASYKQCEELGYESTFFVADGFYDFLPKDCRIVTNVEKPPKADLAIILFPSEKNLPLIWKLKHKGCKVLYIFHEPLASMKVYREAGFSPIYLAKLRVINHISALTVKWSDIILVPSRKAEKYYEENKLYTNKNCHYLPLMYADECEKRHTKMPRMYFSYIGTIAADHSFQEYLNFVEWAVSNNKLIGLSFLVGTKGEFVVPEVLLKSDRVTVKKGMPMSDEEINAYYSSTIVVWNAYVRTTQSGVLAKSFMFGTPALVMRQNLNEFTHDGENVIAIDDNTNFEQIETAVIKIRENIDAFSVKCRKEFEKSFYYKVYNERFKTILNGE